jgi:hypothetical protein
MQVDIGIVAAQVFLAQRRPEVRRGGVFGHNLHR